MTLLSESHRFVFVHVPKSGGTSVIDALGHLQSARFADRIRANKHLRARDLAVTFPELTLDDLFVFAFVRDPYEHLVSWWTYVTEHPFHPDYVDAVRAGTFASWVRMHADRPGVCQCDYTHDRDGTPRVDFVGRHERLAEDFAEVVEIIGCGPVELPHRNSSATEPGRTGRRDPFDEELLELVAERWASDFETFGYEPRRPER